MIAKILSSSLTAIFTLIGIIVSGYAFLINDMEARDEKVKETMRIERNAQISELKSQIQGVETLVKSVDGNVKILLDRSK